MDIFKRSFVPFIPVAGLLILMIAIFFPLFVGGVYIDTGVVYSDLWQFNYPLKDWYRELLLEGKLPFWTSLVGNGFPVFAELQIGALYPFNLLFFSLFPTYIAFNLNIFTHFLMAAVFTYSFVRVSLKRSREAAFLSGIAYSLSAFFLFHIHQINIILVISYLPLVFLIIERFVKSRRMFWTFSLVFVFTLQILAGYIEMFYYTVLLGFIFLLMIGFLFPSESKKEKKSSFWMPIGFAMAVIIATSISAVQLLPTWELVKYTQRSEGLGFEQASATRWPLDTLVFFVNPRGFETYQTDTEYSPLGSEFVDIRGVQGYLGLLPFILAITAVIFWRKRYIVVFSILVGMAFFYGIGRSTQVFAVIWEVVPGLKFFRYPVKILFFIEFGLAILAGFGLDYFRQFLADKKVQKSVIKITVLLVLLVTAGDLYINNVRRLRKVIPAEGWLETPMAVKFLENRLDRNEDRVYSHGTNNIDYSLAQDYEMQKQFQDILPVDLNMIYRIPANREWFALLLDRQRRLNSERTSLDPVSGELGLSDTFKKSLAMQSVKFLVADLPIVDEDLELLKIIPYSQEVGHEAFFPGVEGKRKVVVPALATHIYEYSGVYPRAMLVGESRVIEDEEEVFEAILDSDFDPRQEVILEEKVELDGGIVNQGKVDIVQNDELELELKVKSEGESLLVLADTYYPGWKAEINGVSTVIYRANFAFRAIKIPAGENGVKFWFEPTDWKLGLWISGVSLVIAILGLSYTLLARKRGI